MIPCRGFQELPLPVENTRVAGLVEEEEGGRRGMGGRGGGGGEGLGRDVRRDVRRDVSGLRGAGWGGISGPGRQDEGP